MKLVARLVAAAALVAAASVAVPLSPAAAGTCSSASGVSVVVDFQGLGGGVETACVAGGGGTSAASLFPAAGFGLTPVQRQPGFVCRVSGKPASDPCVNTPPADAYWGLWWSDGTSGSWTYATEGVGSLQVPDGGYVGFSWNGGTRVAPGVAPAKHQVAPSPTPRPTKTPTSGPTKPSNGPASPSTPRPSDTTQASGSAGQPTKSPGGVDGEMLPESGSPSASASASPSASPSASKAKKPGTKPTASASASSPAASASASASDGALVSSDPADPAADSGGLPAWVTPVAIAALFVAAGAVAVVRRRRTNPGP